VLFIEEVSRCAFPLLVPCFQRHTNCMIDFIRNLFNSLTLEFSDTSELLCYLFALDFVAHFVDVLFFDYL
jgi:hypothetical protein